jgi:N-terminal half of MaoC dehydratase
MSDSIITDEMRASLGAVVAEQLSFPISASDIRRWAIAVYYPALPPRHFWDEDFASRSRFRGIIAPNEFNPIGWMAKRPETTVWSRLENIPGIDPSAFRAVLQSEIRVSYSMVPMRPGDVIKKTSRISELFEREGRMGLQLYTTISDELTNQNEEWIKTLETVFVRYR